ncbi:MAG: hypothetical protein GF334_02510 [Candidatus Altiarchaeales archaeon]|nr:hypothetical protein [Candidatus Altiarchaeales archaeon]
MEDRFISPPVEGYVVEVLCTFSNAPHANPRSLHLNDLLRKGLDSEGLIKREYLRITGDLALFVSGIFPDSLEVKSRSVAYDLGYYIDVGRKAYDNLNTLLYEELADNFPQIVDGLNEVSIDIRLTKRDMERYINRRKQIDARATRR